MLSNLYIDACVCFRATGIPASVYSVYISAHDASFSKYNHLLDISLVAPHNSIPTLYLSPTIRPSQVIEITAILTVLWFIGLFSSGIII